VHLCVESLKISMIGGSRALRCLLALTLLVTFITSITATIVPVWFKWMKIQGAIHTLVR
jgi:hypothetical protein